MDFPSNSIHKPTTSVKNDHSEPTKTEPKVIQKVVNGPAIRRKKSIGSRLRELIVPEGKSLYETVVQGVLAPALRDMFSDAIIRGVETMVYGEPQGGRRSSGFRGSVGNGSNIRYNYATPTPRETRPTMSARGRARHDFGEMALGTRVEAVNVLTQMDSLIGRYGSVSVSDLYQMVGEDADYTDEKHGWYQLRGADVRRDRNGQYVLILPPTEPLD